MTAPRTDAHLPVAVGTGLYRFKPWFASRLTPVSERLDQWGVTPSAVSVGGVVAALAGALALAALPAGFSSAAVVLVAVVARLACANIDGSLARRRGSSSRFGAVVNELGDRGADLALLAGLAWHVHTTFAVTVLFASCLPSWVALAGSAAGDWRRNGGPVGKTERAFLCVVAAASGWWVAVALIVTVGSVLTAVVRVRASARALSGSTA